MVLWNHWKPVELVQTYLSSRSQCVSLNNYTSDLLPVLSGVAGQYSGSYLIFINDLPSHVTSSILLFADDTKCYKNTVLMTVWLYKMTCLICIHGVAFGSLISMKVNVLLSDFPLDLLLHHQIKYTSSTAIQLLV